MTTTGPSEGGAMNGGRSEPGSPAPRTVAEPAVITATIGSDAVPASIATVSR
ncbi:hypothetical protein ACFFWC_04425 [Plantactinospora siamensis]|uniref:Uncharacterized protein n=1 Tax=Plantactinospora siamensis TaxID=555372 RepID=A0ABV6NR66_9ACTN